MKKLFYFFMAIGLMISFQACSSDSDPDSSNNDGNNNNDIETPLVIKTMLQTYSDGGQSLIKFVCEDNKLLRIVSGPAQSDPDKRTDYFYEGDLIVREEVLVGSSTSSTEYEYDANSRLIRTYWSNSSGYYDEANINYGENSATIQITYGNIYDGSTSEIVRNVLFSYGNAVAYSSYSDDGNFSYEFTYDDKKNVFSGIKGLDKLAVVNFSHYIPATLGSNNALSVNGVNGTNYQMINTYEYNPEGFPTHVTVSITGHDGSEYLEDYVLEYY